jgi:hypothetical protein
MTTTCSDAWTLTRVTDPLACTVSKPDVTKGIFLCSIHVNTHSSGVVSKRFKSHPDIVIADLNGTTIPVVSISQHMIVFTAASLQRNITFTTEQVVAKPRPQGPILSPHVAKQLFDLAVIRKEQCPITMEDFTVGNTAAMPCGHLFLEMAITESFKKDPYKCPWCRQKGVPTFM